MNDSAPSQHPQTSSNQLTPPDPPARFHGYHLFFTLMIPEFSSSTPPRKESLPHSEPALSALLTVLPLKLRPQVEKHTSPSPEGGAGSQVGAIDAFQGLACLCLPELAG